MFDLKYHHRNILGVDKFSLKERGHCQPWHASVLLLIQHKTNQPIDLSLGFLLGSDSWNIQVPPTLYFGLTEERAPEAANVPVHLAP